MDKKRVFVILVLVLFLMRAVDASIDESFDDDDDDSAGWSRCPSIRNRLKNGRVKIRSRGRIAKFQCDPGFELAGKRFTTCVRGQWNNPIPVCVSRGCFRPPAVSNARVSEMYRGAVLLYECLPGYTMSGGTTVYCDGRQWSSEAPKCEVSTTNPQLSCDFEDSTLCGWSHDPMHDFDWKRNQFATPSGHVGTGPTSDHTFGAGKGGFYLYMEASSPRKVNDTARLFSPVYPREDSGGCFVFWYHMFGSTTGGLRVYVKPESHVFAELSPTWSLFGDQGNKWFRGNVSVPHFLENFQIVIEGIRGSSYIGDTAIDDVSLNAVDCHLIGNSTDQVTETVSTSCRGRCREMNDSYPCGCDDSCVTSERPCCEDFLRICTQSPESEGTENPEENSMPTTLPSKPKSSSKSESDFTTIDGLHFSSPSSSTALFLSTSYPTDKYAIENASAPTNIPSTSDTSMTSSTIAPTLFISSSKPSTTSTTHITTSTSPTKVSTTENSSSNKPTMEFSTVKTSLTLPNIYAKTSVVPLTTAVATISSVVTDSIKSSTSSISSSPSLISSTRKPTTSMTTTRLPSTSATTSSTTSTTLSISSSKPPTTKALTTTSTKLTTPTTIFSKPSTTTTPTTIFSKPSTTTTSTTTPTKPSTTTTSTTTSTLTTIPSTTTSTLTTIPSTISAILSTTSTTPSTTPSRLSTSTSRSSTAAIPSTFGGLTTRSTSSTINRASTTASSLPTSTTRYTMPYNTRPNPYYFSVTTKSNVRYSTAKPVSVTQQEETRRTYDLRPRYRIITPSTRFYRTTTTRRSYFTRGPTFTSPSRKTSTTPRSTSTTPRSTSTPIPSTKMTTGSSSPTTEIVVKTPLKPKEEYHSSVDESNVSEDGNSFVAIVCVSVLVLVGLAGGVIFYIKRWRSRRQSKLAEDSEMRFLYENEVSEFSDASALDRINFNPPLI